MLQGDPLPDIFWVGIDFHQALVRWIPLGVHSDVNFITHLARFDLPSVPKLASWSGQKTQDLWPRRFPSWSRNAIELLAGCTGRECPLNPGGFPSTFHPGWATPNLSTFQPYIATMATNFVNNFGPNPHSIACALVLNSSHLGNQNQNRISDLKSTVHDTNTRRTTGESY